LPPWSLLGSLIMARAKEITAMPRQKDLKRIVRSRMQKTGESYASARAQVVKSSRARESEERPAATVDYAALAGQTDDTIRTKTGRTWAEWVKELDGLNAREMRHKDIATIVYERYEVDGWWSQAVTVGYERIKGLREIGQRLDGAFEASKSKTFDVPVEALFEAWADDATRRLWLTDADAGVRTATPPRAMRLQWPDGSIVAVWFTPKGDTKSNVALAHQKLPDRGAVEQAKQQWATRLDALGRLLEE
jgi:uncharacterized protein YndB with AHSA1/START domain